MCDIAYVIEWRKKSKSGQKTFNKKYTEMIRRGAYFCHSLFVGSLVFIICAVVIPKN